MWIHVNILKNIYCMCVYLYIHNKYTQYTNIYYIYKNFYFEKLIFIFKTYYIYTVYTHTQLLKVGGQ